MTLFREPSVSSSNQWRAAVVNGGSAYDSHKKITSRKKKTMGPLALPLPVWPRLALEQGHVNKRHDRLDRPNRQHMTERTRRTDKTRQTEYKTSRSERRTQRRQQNKSHRNSNINPTTDTLSHTSGNPCSCKESQAETSSITASRENKLLHFQEQSCKATPEPHETTSLKKQDICTTARSTLATAHQRVAHLIYRHFFCINIGIS